MEGAPADEHAEVWLTPDQLASWLSVVGLITRLPRAIDAHLQRSADLSMTEYMTMAMLAKAPRRRPVTWRTSGSWSSTTCPRSGCAGSGRTPTASSGGIDSPVR